ncbi:LCP family protein [Streptomyces sp. NBC_00669]|uniref:LCP family protein n=1 Tax=Streptomyces sp. NBC_00669 TaxID=2976011 RepID=UPI002E3162CF|nr:LCP family protein [Streptomyces sp. NBC_00669]
MTTPAEPPQDDSAADAADGSATEAADAADQSDTDSDGPDADDGSDADKGSDSGEASDSGEGSDTGEDAPSSAAAPVAEPTAEGTADAPKEPGPPEASDASDVPEVPDVPNAPEIPGISNSATAEDSPEDAPGTPETAVAAAAADTPAAPAPRRRFRWLKVVAISTAVLVLACAGGVWYVYQQLNGNITTDTVTENELKAQASQRPPEGPASTENILLIGSDIRDGANAKYGKDSGQRSDTTILLHLSADRSNATAVSIPRDLMMHVPKCTKSDGSTVSPAFEQFNWAFQFGGAACTIRAVEELTGVRVDHHLIVDFSGFKKMVNAVDGVEICTPEPIDDSYSRLHLSAGKHKLNGEQALGYVRVRHGIGDGSDTERISRQQDFLASLIKKVQSNGVLLNPGKVYPLLNAATHSLTADPGLNSLSELYSLAQRLQKIPTGAIHFVTTPVEQYVKDRNRDQLVEPDADNLFAAVRADQPVRVSSDGKSSGSHGGSSTAPGSPDPSGTPSGSTSGTPSNTPSSTPSNTLTFKGTTADRDICGEGR